MKKLFLNASFILLLVPSISLSQADFSVTWALSGLSGVEEMVVDIDIGTAFLSAHGAVRLTNGLTVPMTGTCFITASGGIFCSFNLTQGISGSLDIGANLNGSWITFDLNGNIIESGIATFINVI